MYGRKEIRYDDGHGFGLAKGGPTANVQQQGLKGKLNSGSAYQLTYVSKPEPRLAGEIATASQVDGEGGGVWKIVLFGIPFLKESRGKTAT